MKCNDGLKVGVDVDIVIFRMDKIAVRASYADANQHTFDMSSVFESEQIGLSTER